MVLLHFKRIFLQNRDFYFKTANLLFIYPQVHFAGPTGSDLRCMDAVWEHTHILDVWFDSFTNARVCVYGGVWYKMHTLRVSVFEVFLLFNARRYRL